MMKVATCIYNHKEPEAEQLNALLIYHNVGFTKHRSLRMFSFVLLKIGIQLEEFEYMNGQLQQRA